MVLGLLSDLPRKDCWSIAGVGREASPDGMQHLLRRARWDARCVRDDVVNMRWSIWASRRMRS